MPTVRAALLTAAVALLAGCAPDALPTASSPRSAPTAARRDAGDDVGTTQRRLERAAEGLLYTSESDYPFVFFAHPAVVSGPLTVELFRAAVGVPADSTVEQFSLDAFFARHIELADPNDAVAQALVPQYRHLKTVIRTSVREARVFRVGQVLIRCYIVGTDASGNVVGLTTWAVET